MDPVTPFAVTVWVTRPVLWSAGTGVIQYWPVNGLVWACDVASIDIMLIMKSVLMHMARGFEIFLVCIERAIFSKMFVFNFLSLPELLEQNIFLPILWFFEKCVSIFCKVEQFYAKRS
jgi:hypothetical protein